MFKRCAKSAAGVKRNNVLTETKLAIIIQQGKVLDFVDGKTQRNETPEEYVRQFVWMRVSSSG